MNYLNIWYPKDPMALLMAFKADLSLTQTLIAYIIFELLTVPNCQSAFQVFIIIIRIQNRKSNRHWVIFLAVCTPCCNTNQCVICLVQHSTSFHSMVGLASFICRLSFNRAGMVTRDPKICGIVVVIHRCQLIA